MALRRSGESLAGLIKRYRLFRAIGRRISGKRIPRPQAVPIELAGKWIAWSADGRTIVASGDSPRAARDAARALGVANPRCEWVPKQEQLRSTPRKVTTS